MDNVAKDLLPIHLAKFVPLIILTDEKCIHNVASIRFVGNASLALELRTISWFSRIRCDIPVPSNYARPNYLGFE